MPWASQSAWSGTFTSDQNRSESAGVPIRPTIHGEIMSKAW